MFLGILANVSPLSPGNVLPPEKSLVALALDVLQLDVLAVGHEGSQGHP